MLALRIEYLTGACMATRHDDPSRATPEWPPHPDRLFSALVAAAAQLQDVDHGSPAEGSLCARAERALRWLCKQDAPHLHASDAERRFAPDVHMPSNPHEDEVWQRPKKNRPRDIQKSFDLRSLLPVHRKKTALPIPVVIPHEPVVFFIWPDVVADDHLAALQDICEQVTYLGRSRSLVRASVVSDRRSTPADIAAFRIDFRAFLKSLSRRDRRVAIRLAKGHATQWVAKKFRISAARVSQLRRELCDAWREFHGELAPVGDA